MTHLPTDRAHVPNQIAKTVTCVPDQRINNKQWHNQNQHEYNIGRTHGIKTGRKRGQHYTTLWLYAQIWQTA